MTLRSRAGGRSFAAGLRRTPPFRVAKRLGDGGGPFRDLGGPGCERTISGGMSGGPAGIALPGPQRSPVAVLRSRLGSCARMWRMSWGVRQREISRTEKICRKFLEKICECVRANCAHLGRLTLCPRGGRQHGYSLPGCRAGVGWPIRRWLCPPWPRPAPDRRWSATCPTPWPRRMGFPRPPGGPGRRWTGGGR